MTDINELIRQARLVEQSVYDYDLIQALADELAKLRADNERLRLIAPAVREACAAELNLKVVFDGDPWDAGWNAALNEAQAIIRALDLDDLAGSALASPPPQQGE